MLSGNHNNEAAAHCTTQITQHYSSKTAVGGRCGSRRGCNTVKNADNLTSITITEMVNQ